ncbi:hypothetical protein EVAR_52699_1 [Eumeta japonica]|uniref:Uncharacterized protein n=1 Tax=Eumeta variegata TaxID=151549 RepID=A0A4C1Y4G3_EUMVA|nr:hypothetical protein EVAR_52699_1 [Eumeta japonica]
MTFPLDTPLYVTNIDVAHFLMGLYGTMLNEVTWSRSDGYRDYSPTYRRRATRCLLVGDSHDPIRSKPIRLSNQIVVSRNSDYPLGEKLSFKYKLQSGLPPSPRPANELPEIKRPYCACAWPDKRARRINKSGAWARPHKHMALRPQYSLVCARQICLRLIRIKCNETLTAHSAKHRRLPCADRTLRLRFPGSGIASPLDLNFSSKTYIRWFDWDKTRRLKIQETLGFVLRRLRLALCAGRGDNALLHNGSEESGPNANFRKTDSEPSMIDMDLDYNKPEQHRHSIIRDASICLLRLLDIFQRQLQSRVGTGRHRFIFILNQGTRGRVLFVVPRGRRLLKIVAAHGMATSGTDDLTCPPRHETDCSI